MKGFFTKQETQSKTRPSGRLHTCASCGLSVGVKTPKMKPFGNFKKKILNVGEAPGEFEDARGRQWQGPVGQRLQKAYKKLGIDLFEDCLNINAVNCRPTKDGNNRPPTNNEIAACRKIVLETVNKYKPEMIILLGGAALTSLIDYRWKNKAGGISRWRGWTIPDRDFNCWICPTFHPSYVERSEQEVETIWLQDLERFFNLIDAPLPGYKEPNIEIINNLIMLNKWNGAHANSLIVAIDYETTGLKPHATGHRIVCAAVADSEDHCYVFELPSKRSELQPFLQLLSNPGVSKVAHNIKFEENWSVIRLKQPVENWTWDTMLMAHVLDNRSGVTGLKFQTYINFGVIDYASEVSSYIESAGGGNTINRVHELLKKPSGKEMLLNYCGMDAVLTYRLAMKQMKIINK